MLDHSVRDVLLSCGTGEGFGKVVATVISPYKSHSFYRIERNILGKGPAKCRFLGYETTYVSTGKTVRQVRET
jgi:hypothetical protein